MLTQLGHALLATIHASTLGTIVVLSPRFIRLVDEARLATTLARAHRTALRVESLFDVARELGTFVSLARDHAHVACASRARVRSPLRVLQVAFAFVVAREIC